MIDHAKTPDAYWEEWIQIDRLRVRYLHAGHGQALVLLHGLLGYSFNWRKVIPDLANSHEVFVPDMPGSGFSECSAETDCTLASAARRFLKFLDVLGIQSCDLIASSYGGSTAMIAASLAPSRIRRLVLVSPANPWSRIGRKRLALLRIPVVAKFFPTVGRWVKPLRGYFIRRMYGDPSRLTLETMRSHFLPLDRRGVLEHGVHIVKTWPNDMHELEATLPKISAIRTLIVWGSRDRTVDPASAGPLSANFLSVQVAIIEGAGHLPYEECPKEFLEVVEPFLAAGPSTGHAREVT